MLLNIFYFTFLLYEELLYKLIACHTINISFINSLFYLAFIALILGIITRLFRPKHAKHIFRIIVFVISAWYGVCIIVRKTFDITLSLVATSMADQFAEGGFINLALEVIGQNWWVILLIVIPFVSSFFLSKLIKKDKNKHDYFNLKKIITGRPVRRKEVIIPNMIIIIITYLLFISSICFLDIGNYDLKDLYFVQQNNTYNVENFGVLPSLVIEIRKSLTSFEEEIVIDEINENEIIEEEIEQIGEPEEIQYEGNSLDIDFDYLIKNESNKTLSNMHKFFKTETITSKNEHTGLFKDKNLIYIMAETFDGYAVSKELTPTLYKMIHDGFYFSNFYSPTNLSTIGGEFSLLTGLVPYLNTLSYNWRASSKNANYYPYGLGSLFKERNYSTYAYHDHQYDFQDRNLYLKNIGFDNYQACYNGLEKKIHCNQFPESDDEMINATYQDWINDDHFMVYYATVSGHMGWGWGNPISAKHKDEVKDLDYSTTVKAYVAAQIELDKAMESLLRVLEESGKLDDTVIVLSTDHHPYGMSFEQMKELAGKDIDETFELYRNNLIIYNSTVEHQVINKAANTIDILPTVLNLFGIDYDSRLIIGKDILSDSEGLVLFSDGSWISDSGKFNHRKNSFIPTVNLVDEESYKKKTNNLAYNRVLMSRYIMQYDYYDRVLNRKKLNAN